MDLTRKLFGAGLVAAMALAVGAPPTFAQDKKPMAEKAAPAKPAKKKKSKCKDGETEKVASYKVSKGENLDVAINASLTGKPGDPKTGVKWMTHRRLGNCIACHEVSALLAKAKPGDLDSLKKYGFHGKIAPTLDGVASRYTEGELRMIVVNAKKAFPDADSIMPTFHENSGFHGVIGDCKGLAILSAERVEDVVAFLKTLKE